MAKQKKSTRRRRKTHLETLMQLVREKGRGKEPHQVLRTLIQERRAENLLLRELRRAVRRWGKAPSKLPRHEVARRWARLLKM